MLGLLPSLLSAAVLAGANDRQAPLPEQPQSSIGYPNVDAALSALQARADVAFSIESGWTIAVDRAARTIWSFAPKSSPAFPAVVKRQVIEQNGTVSVKMDVLCAGSKAACDDLVRTFKAVTDQASSRR